MPPTKTLSIALQLDQGNLRAGLGQSATELTNFDKKLGGIGATAGKGFGDATKHVSTFRAGLGQTAQDLGKVGDKITLGVALPLAAAGTAAVKLSNDFETAFAHMVGLAGVPQSEIEGLKKTVLDLSGTTAQAPVDLANALYFVESAGLHGATAVEALTVSAKAAQAGMGEASGIADALTSVISAYGAANITAAQAGDVLAVAVRDGKAEAASFAPELGRLLPMAVQLKIPFDQVAGSLAYLTRGSGDTALSATQLAGVLNALLAPSSQAALEMQQLGVSTDTVHQSLQQNGLLATLEMLRSKLGDNSDAMHQLFPDVRALNGALQLTNDGGKATAEVLNDTANATGALDEAQKAVAGTSANQMKQAFTDIQVDLVKVGAVIAPLAATVAGGVASMVDAFSSLPAPIQDAILVLAALVASGGVALSMFGRVASGVRLAGEALASLRALRAGEEVLQLSSAATNSASAVGNLYQKSGALSGALGKAGIAGAALLAFGAVVQFGDSLNKAVVSEQDLVAATKMSGDASSKWLDNLKAFSETRTGPGNMQVFAGEFNKALEGLVKQGPAGIGVLQSYSDHLHAAGQDATAVDNAITGAVAAQANLTTNTDKGNAAFTQTPPAIAPVIASLEDLTALQGGLIDLGSQLAQSMGKQYDAMLAPQKATDSYKQSTNDLIDTLHKETFTLDDSNTAHGKWNEHALKNIAAAQQLGGSISDLVQQTYAHTHSVDAAVQAGELYVEDLKNQLAAAGFTEDQVKQLIDTMHLTPDEIRTAFSTNAIEQQLAIIKYQQTLATLPPDVRTLIEAELKNGDLDRANKSLNDFIDKKRVINVDVDTTYHGPGATFKAAGGPVQAGHRYVVTEKGDEAFIGSKGSALLRGRGPQLWVAPSDGEIVPNHMLRHLAEGTSGAGGAIAAAQAHAGALASAHDVLAGSGTGALVAAEASLSNSDAAQAMQETERQLSQLAAAYVNVAEVAGQAAADQLAASNLTADEFTDAAQRIVQGARDQAAAEKQAAEDAKRAAEEQQRAAEETARTHMAINDARFQLGLVSQADRLGVLSKRLGQVSQDSLEYYQILGQIQSLQSNVAQEHMAEHDVQFQVGDLDAGTYRQMLQARLDATDKYSADYKKAWDDLRSFDQAQAAAQEKINQERAQQVKDQQDLEDRFYEHGQMSTEQYLAVLQKRLAAEEAAGRKSSATWFEISDDIAAAQKKIVDDTTTSAQEFADAIDKMTKPLSGAFTANLGFLDSLQRMVDQIHEAGGSLDELTTTGRQDLSAIASAVQSAEENAVARYTRTGDLAGSTQLLQQNLDSIRASLTAQGVSGADVDKLFGQLGVNDSDVQSLLTLPHGGGGAGTVVQGDQTNVGTQNINLAFHLGSVGDAIDADMQRMIAQVAISTARNVARGVAA